MMKRNVDHLGLFLSILFVLPSVVFAQNFALIDQKPSNTDLKAATPAIPAEKAQSESKGLKAAEAFAKEQGSKYTLGKTDVIEITVQRHPEVSGNFILNSEGKIQYQFVGDIQLSGLTKEEAEPIIVKALEKYIINPEVTIQIVEYNSKVVYVVGEVGLPGKVYMRGNTITVRDALLAAGLPQLTAATESATLFTPSADGKVVLRKVNVRDLLYKGDLRQNYVMRPGDTIYLPATLWAKVARFINPVTQPIGQAAGTAASIHAF